MGNELLGPKWSMSYLCSQQGNVCLVQTLIALLAACLICPILIVLIDLPVAMFVREELHPMVVRASKGIDDFDDYVLWICLALMLRAAVTRHYARVVQWAFPVVAYLMSGLVGQLLKGLFGRGRPKLFWKHELFDFEPFHFFDSIRNSFPSGHTTATMALATAFALLFPKYRVACYSVALLVGLGRIGAGAHFPADVLAGLVVGYCITIHLFHCWRFKKWL